MRLPWVALLVLACAAPQRLPASLARPLRPVEPTPALRAAFPEHFPVGHALAGDLDGDGRDDFHVTPVLSSARVYVVDADHRVRSWQYDAVLVGCVLAAELDGDPVRELVECWPRGGQAPRCRATDLAGDAWALRPLAPERLTAQGREALAALEARAAAGDPCAR